MKKMTREEKISILRQVKDIIQRSDSWMIDVKNAVNEAFESAIEDLQKEPCEDTISREHLISELETNLSYDRCDYSLEEFMSYVNDEPSVNPILKKSSGIFNKDSATESMLNADLIDRQAVLDILDRHTLSRMALYEIEDLQPVQPPKVGKWLLFDDESNSYCCSVCNTAYMLIEGTPKDNGYKYCPNCGAKLEEDAENKDIYEDYPCRKCDFAAKQSCCGCPEEKEWQEKHKNGGK